MDHPESWTKTDLHKHLQQAADVEFWTIPLYLTALYSIRDLKTLSPDKYPLDAKLILSIAIQEMLHLEIVANLSNALGYSPVLKKPIYNADKGIPYLHPEVNHLPLELKDYVALPAALSVESLKLFCAIEIPVTTIHKDWESKKGYSSIAEMYAALRIGIEHLWDDCFVGSESNLKQKSTFNSYQRAPHQIGFSQTVNSLQDALAAMDAIVEQGEGADASGFVPKTFQPKDSLGEYDPGNFDGDWSHYHKFHFLLQHSASLSATFPLISKETSPNDYQQLNEKLEELIAQLNLSFLSNGKDMTPTFWSAMTALQNEIIQLWESGLCPKWE